MNSFIKHSHLSSLYSRNHNPSNEIGKKVFSLLQSWRRILQIHNVFSYGFIRQEMVDRKSFTTDHELQKICISIFKIRTMWAHISSHLFVAKNLMLNIAYQWIYYAMTHDFWTLVVILLTALLQILVLWWHQLEIRQWKCHLHKYITNVKKCTAITGITFFCSMVTLK